MDRFECDYAEGAYPEILNELVRTNLEQHPGYGCDTHCRNAAELIKAACNDPKADVYFVAGGTQANTCVIASQLKPWQGAVCADSGHIAVHEAGAVEATGHKVLTIKGKAGKLAASDLKDLLNAYKEDPNREHTVEPGLVYISHPTEFGTLYSKKELSEISAVCKEFGIPLYLDGARLGYGLASPATDVRLTDIAALCDIFYIGGTKVGAMFGEAIVFTAGRGLDRGFRSVIKQKCSMTAKGRLIGVQFEALFTEGLYEKIAAHAVKEALRIREALKAKGLKFPVHSDTNQQFVLLPRRIKEKLSENFSFECEGDRGQEEFLVRFCTSWAAEEAAVDRLIRAIKES